MVRRNNSLRLENLESRVCLSVSAVVEASQLLVSGVAEGPVSILATDEGGLVVSEGDTEVAEITDQISSIHLRLDFVAVEEPIDPDGAGDDPGEGDGGDGGEEKVAADDAVTIDLGGGELDRIMARLGAGNNELTVSNAILSQGIFVRSRDGNDTVSIAEDVDAGRGVLLALGDGENSALVDGDVSGRLMVRAGDGGDRISIGAAAEIGWGASIRLGDGDNSTSVDGQVDHSVMLRGGDGTDDVSVAPGAAVGRLYASLGEGTNTLTFEGAAGGIGTKGGDGSDNVTIGAAATIDGSAKITLGSGDNTVAVAGSIEGNLTVKTDNESDLDNIEVADDEVSGNTDIVVTGEDNNSHGHGFADRIRAALERFRQRIRDRFRHHHGDGGDNGGETDPGNGGETDPVDEGGETNPDENDENDGGGEDGHRGGHGRGYRLLGRLFGHRR